MSHCFETLYKEALSLGISVDQKILCKSTRLDGLYLCFDDEPIILINGHRPLAVQTIALAEELGHHYRSTGIIIEQSTVAQRKSEQAGRAWSYESLLPLQVLRDALYSGTCTLYELSDRFNLPEGFIREAITHYQRKSLLMTAAQCHWCYSA